ncbi:MAG: copper-binding protein [Bdellovibrionales bacterium]|nr:copper-binding protein [Massilia sp.]
MKLISKLVFTAAIFGSTALTPYAIAHEGHGHEQPATMVAPVVPNQMSSGEIKKIDKSAAKLTVQHGPLQNLNMPGMTMVFKVKDTAMLENVKVGDKINFVAEKINGSLTLTQLEASK